MPHILVPRDSMPKPPLGSVINRACARNSRLWLYYPFLGESKDLITDAASGYNLNAIVEPQNTHNSYFGYGLKFDGSTQYCRKDITPNLAGGFLSPPLTLIVSFVPGTISANRNVIFNIGPVADNLSGWEFRAASADTAGFPTTLTMPNVLEVVLFALPTNNVPYTMVLSFSTALCTQWVYDHKKQILNTISTASTTPGTPMNAISIGANCFGTNFFNGSIYRLEVHRGVLFDQARAVEAIFYPYGRASDPRFLVSTTRRWFIPNTAVAAATTTANEQFQRFVQPYYSPTIIMV